MEHIRPHPLQIENTQKTMVTDEGCTLFRYKPEERVDRWQVWVLSMTLGSFLGGFHYSTPEKRDPTTVWTDIVITSIVAFIWRKHEATGGDSW